MFKLWFSFIWRLLLLLTLNGAAAAGLIFVLPSSTAAIIVGLSWVTALALSYTALRWALSIHGIEEVPGT